MKRLVSLFFLIIFTFFLWLTLAKPSVVLAQPADKGNHFTLVSNGVSTKTDWVRLINNNTYTVSLPIIFAPPAPSLKKGFGAPASPACADLIALRASWYINWKTKPDPTCGSANNSKFVPRIYDESSMQELTQAITNAQASGWLIGFSEPNLPWQGNLSPTKGAILWRQIEAAADPAGIKLVSPSPNQWNPGQNGLPYGHQWLWAMVDAYKAQYGQNPRFDAIGWNIYKPTAGEIQTYLNARHNEALSRGYDVPIWLLEYGGDCVGSSTTNIEATMQAITPWLNATPWIGRYAWFANRLSGPDPTGVNYSKCTLINVSGNLTSLGSTYWGY